MRHALVLAAGALMEVSSIAHAGLGWPMMARALRDAGLDADLTGALAAGWIFGSVAMLGFGGIVLQAGVRMRRGDPSGIPAVRIIAAAYVLFGAGAFVLRDFNPHFLLFVGTGLLAGLPLLGRGGPEAYSSRLQR
jgi:hypothetical protein